MKCFTRVALCILNGDASLRILSTDASGCFFINVTFIAVAEISIRGDFFSKVIINSVSLTCFSFIQFYSELTSLYISTPYTVGTPYNTNVGVQKIPDRAIWKPVVAKRNNTNPWSCSEPQILVTRDSRQVHMAEQPTSPHPATGLSKFLPSCIHHRLPDNSLISVNL